MRIWSMGWIAGVLVVGVSGASWGITGDAWREPAPALAASRLHAEEGPILALAEPVSFAATDAAAGRLPLERINGLALTDDLKTIYELKGEPLGEEDDQLFPDERVLVFEDCKVGLYKQSVQAVIVPASAGEIVIDEERLPLNADKLRAVLGEPDWVAEDGIVYKRERHALKVFLDAEDGSLLSVHLFHHGF
ncbi:hypothetical protein SAMN02799630_04627 [Paenibacillus sp. UNCCL117]|uniref:hypothetical protein n=1 Tax=unclassified Paenibacillus TaxID=185978 RepID=UPI00088FB473|nr:MULTISPECIES: hypothetical protein [unclassified Paenibacillus]SDE08033.1 hypothetical protein SAMN04488602_11868 [Paenibacillus sp. cl123]SFW59050.1 hypothetical protein SAMN02799630_04627 [Paenibacillus sp. UNCCL117]